MSKKIAKQLSQLFAVVKLCHRNSTLSSRVLTIVEMLGNISVFLWSPFVHGKMDKQEPESVRYSMLEEQTLKIQPAT
jgi:hypothetical protein